MNSVVIPLIFVLAIALFPGAKSDRLVAEEISDPQALLHQVETSYSNKQNDYESIYSYIRSKYKKVSDEDAKEIARHLVDSCESLSLDPKFVAALIARESAFRKDAVSSTGARGLGQIKDFNFKSLNIDDPENIKQNVNGTASYIKQMLSKWSGKSGKVSLALASYFRGYTTVKNLSQFDPKTQEYVTDIIRNYNHLSSLSALQNNHPPVPSQGSSTISNVQEGTL